MAAVKGVKRQRVPRGYGSRPKQIRPGYWVAQVSFGRKADGSRDRRAVVGHNETDVKNKVMKLRPMTGQPTQVASEVRHVDELIKRYLAAKKGLAPSTRQRYKAAFDYYVLPSLGRHRLETLTAATLNNFFNDCWNGQLAKAASARVAVKSSTVSNVRIALGSVCQFGVTSGLLTQNVVRLSEPIAVTSRPAYEMNEDELSAFLRACATHEQGALFETILFQALREAEGFGLRWRSVDSKKNELDVRWQVRQEAGKGCVGSAPKWGSSRKETPLMSGTRAALRRRRAQQNRDRLAAGEQWHRSDYVFTTASGAPLYPQLAWRWFRQICDAAGIPCRPQDGEHLTIGDLRHNGARMHSKAGTRIEVIAKLLGHSRTSTTETYLGLTHFVPSLADVGSADRYFTALQKGGGAVRAHPQADHARPSAGLHVRAAS